MSLHNPFHWPEILVERLRERLSFLWGVEARLKGANVGSTVSMIGRPIISVARNSTLALESGVMLRSGRRSNVLGCFQPCILRTVAQSAELTLGKNVGLSATVVCAAKCIRIGENTITGAGAMILDNDFHRLSPDGSWPPDCEGTARPVIVGRSVFIGARALVLKGVTIGNHAVIGAGAVVAKDVPADCLAAGNPATVVRRDIHCQSHPHRRDEQ